MLDSAAGASTRLLDPGPWCLAIAGMAAGCGLTIGWSRLHGGPDDRRLTQTAYGWTAALWAVAAGLALSEPSLRTRLAGLVTPDRAVAWCLLPVLALLGLGPARRPGALGGRIEWLISILWLAVSAWVASGTAAIPPADALARSAFRPETAWAGALALGSSASMGLAVVLLASRCQEPGWATSPRSRVERLLGWSLIVQLAATAGFVLALGPVADLAFGTGRGRWLPLAIVPMGLVLPGVLLSLKRRPGWAVAAASGLVLVGGFLLRLVLGPLPMPLLVYPR